MPYKFKPGLVTVSQSGKAVKLDGLAVPSGSDVTKNYVDQQDAETLASAKEYTDTELAALSIPDASAVADCYDDADPAKTVANKWYIPKTMPRPSGENGMTIDVRWKNGHVDGIGYDVTLIWGEPDGADNEAIVGPISASENLTGEYSIPVEGTVRYQLVEANGRKHWKYVSGALLPKQYSSATDAAISDKVVPGLSLAYLPGMEIYVQMDNGNTAQTMRLVPDDGETLPVYGNGQGRSTGRLPVGYICHLKNAGDHWQLINSPGVKQVFTAVISDEVGRYVCDMTSSEIINADRMGVVKAEFSDPKTGELRTYYYAKQDSTGRAVFSKDGYIEDGVPKQALIYVDRSGNVEVETREPTVDTELSETSEFPVQNKVVNAAISELSLKKAEQSEVDKITSRMKLTYGENRLDSASVKPGYIDSNGNESALNNCVYSVPIYVTPGEKLRMWYFENGTVNSRPMRFLCAYNENGSPVPSKGSDENIAEYVVPDGIYSVVVSYYARGNVMLTLGSDPPLQFVPYYPPIYIAGPDFVDAYTKKETKSLVDASAITQETPGKNLIDSSKSSNGYVDSYGRFIESKIFKTSDFISVKPGDILAFSYSENEEAGPLAGPCHFRFTSAYNSSGKMIDFKDNFGGSYTVPDNAVSVRVAWDTRYFAYVQLEKTCNGLFSYGYEPYTRSFKEKPEYNPEIVHCYLPPYIYVAVGRTIELYNSLVCLEADKYNIQWICSKGSAYSRKFSITGTTKLLNGRDSGTVEMGEYRLFLNVRNDKDEVVWAGQTIIHVSPEITSDVSVLPIGDSLTNWKAWLQETMKLSGDHVKFMGTRYSGESKDSAGKVYPSGTIHHEGRSGFSAADYLKDTKYTFDDRYDGVSSVSGTDNPFWDGSKFSLRHYLTAQTKAEPDIVQIYLGTNDLASGPDDAARNVLGLVNAIREEYPQKVIVLVNTIYRSAQDGYASVGSDGYATASGAGAYQRGEDLKVYGLMDRLNRMVIGMENVYIAPLAVCHDREYNFGDVLTPVNPRAAQKVPYPAESVHPQAQGYYQMADNFYGIYSRVQQG